MGKIMFFTSQTCSRCRSNKKYIETLKETDCFDFIDIDTDRGATLVETYCITSLPTLILIKDGTIVKRLETVILPNDLKEIINKYKEIKD